MCLVLEWSQDDDFGRASWFETSRLGNLVTGISERRVIIQGGTQHRVHLYKFKVVLGYDKFISKKFKLGRGHGDINVCMMGTANTHIRDIFYFRLMLL